ncbi:MAG: hypothetical protein V4505_00685 [Pseudomonadota bacterium]
MLNPMVRKMPQVLTDFYPMAGGLDLMTPAVALSPGKCFDCQNYFPQISGGYSRLHGFERYDGRQNPSSASYWVMAATMALAISVGDTVTGGTSAATGKVLALSGDTIVMGRVSGTFVLGEALMVAAVTVATATSTAQQNGAAVSSDDADYMLLAANDLRADIQPVPGSGPIRGVWNYNDVEYAFRDNAGATAGGMWRATTGGWVPVTFGTEIQFTGAVGQVFDGNVVTGGTSGATATVVCAMLRTGTWTVGGAGTLVITVTGGTFQNGEALKVAAVTKATSSSLATAISRLPGGRVEAVNANFTGSTATKRMYGADGVNLAFEFDGTNYIPIRTGMTTDTPLHAMAHQNYLFLSFLGSAQYSGLGLPYAWTAVLGAGEIATGETITGFLPQTGSTSGPSMGIYTTGRTFVLYGSSNIDFQLVNSAYDLGYSAYTLQPVGNDSWGLTARGVEGLTTTLSYGDFDFDSLTHLIAPFMNTRRGTQIASYVSKNSGEYRLFFADGTGVTLGLTGSKPNGAMPLNYGKVVRCCHSSTLGTGVEVIYFGSDDGYVFRDAIGTSFDGAPIEAWIRPAFNNLKSPRIVKRYRRANFDVKASGYASVNITYDLGYANTDAQQSAARPDLAIVGAGGYWDQFIWDQFTWDTQVVTTSTISVEGSASNISFLFYSNRAQDQPHTVQAVSLAYTPRRMARTNS